MYELSDTVLYEDIDIGYCMFGDCLDAMNYIEDESVDMVLCDLPYGTTKCKWDVLIPLDKLWEHYKRITKKGSAIVLFASQHFTSLLVCSNLDWFKYCWVWDKVRAVGAHTSKIRCMQRTEDIAVFGLGKITYNPILIPRDKPRVGGKEYGRTEIIGGRTTGSNDGTTVYTHFQPTNVLVYSNASNKNRVHPTQKPVELCEYLIKTHSNDGDTVLDNTMGSGSTGVACVNTRRNFIGIENDRNYFDIALDRISGRL